MSRWGVGCGRVEMVSDAHFFNSEFVDERVIEAPTAVQENRMTASLNNDSPVRLTVRVTAPSSRIVSGGRPAHISNLFMHEQFTVRVSLNDEHYAWTVTLPEWLEALTEQLKMEADGDVRRLLLYSGEQFVSRKSGDKVTLCVYDIDASKNVSIELTVDHARQLHKVVLEGFLQAVRAAQDCSFELTGMETVRL